MIWCLSDVIVFCCFYLSKKCIIFKVFFVIKKKGINKVVGKKVMWVIEIILVEYSSGVKIEVVINNIVDD